MKYLVRIFLRQRDMSFMIVSRSDSRFRRPMGCYDGAEVCELLESYMINQLKHIVIKESIGLYQDVSLEISIISPSQKKKERKSK